MKVPVAGRANHAAQVAFPGAAKRAEDRIFGAIGDQPVESSGRNLDPASPAEAADTAAVQALRELPGLDSNQQPSG
jgi:hypothetical protein